MGQKAIIQKWGRDSRGQEEEGVWFKEGRGGTRNHDREEMESTGGWGLVDTGACVVT